jgi:hypothetical protein
MPGSLVHSEGGARLECKPVDISRTGIGVLIAHEIKVDTLLLLIIGDQKISMKVVWSQPDFAKSDRFRYGLNCEDESIDMEELFASKNCFR